MKSTWRGTGSTTNEERVQNGNVAIPHMSAAVIRSET